MSERTRKIESQLREIVSEQVASLSDPRINGLVTVTAARVSPDIAQATIFYSVLDGEDETSAHEGLQSAAGRIQSAVGSQTHTKRTPRLRFEPDPVIEQANKIDAALKEVQQSDHADHR